MTIHAGQEEVQVCNAGQHPQMQFLQIKKTYTMLYQKVNH